MIEFGKKLEEIEKLQQDRKWYDLSSLEQSSLILAHCARASPLKTWKVVPFDDLIGGECPPIEKPGQSSGEETHEEPIPSKAGNL